MNFCACASIVSCLLIQAVAVHSADAELLRKEKSLDSYAAEDAELSSRQFGTDLQNHRHWNLLRPDICGVSMRDRIIGGTNASLGQYPWLARLGYVSSVHPNDNGFKCGGTLVSPRYVVTAAHCVVGIPEDLTLAAIRLGEHFTFSDIDCLFGVCAAPVQDFVPIQILVHSNYNNPGKFQNDVGLIRLDRPVMLNGWVIPICLPTGTQLYQDYTGAFAEVAGWGVTDSSQLTTPSNYLLTVKLPIIPLGHCVNHFSSQAMVTESQLCVGGVPGKDSCAGDSGGPLMIPESVRGGPPRYFLQGIVSFGPKRCGSSTVPAVYTRVASFVFWVLENIQP